MDTTTSHILLKLDAIERLIGELRHERTAAASSTSQQQDSQTKAKGFLSRVRSWPPFWQNFGAIVLGWGFTSLLSAYLKRGGDPMALIDLFLKYAF